jgi:uncharacterized membrane protein YbhN (UPF0104 family)
LKRWQLWLGLLFSAFFVWLAVQGLELAEVWQNIRQANYWWLVPGVGAYFIGVWVRTWRWDYMLRPIKRVAVRSLFPVVVIGYMGNNVYPFRAGEILRSYVLRRREAVPMSASLATVIVERVFVFFVLAAAPERALQLARWVSNRFIPEKAREPVLEFTVRFLQGLESLRSFRNVLMIFFTSVIVWLLETVKYWFVMQAFPFQVSFFALMLMNGVVNLATTLPSAPGYVGTFDTPGIAVLVLYGVSNDLAGAYTLVLHAALWLPITLLGAYFMLREGLGWSDFGRATKVAESEAAS